MSRILIIEDEENLARFVELELKHDGYETDVELDGRQGLDAALNQDFDVILLDLMLPELNGLEVARRVREVKDTPIIIMTARDSVIDRVSGLDHGADDYIVKPFAIEELLARVRALLRRISIEGDANSVHQTTVTYKDLTIEKENRVVRRGDEVINLTKREYELLLILMENINVVMSRKELLSKVWGYDSKVETNVVDVYIRYLRNKIDRPGEKSYIQTVRGTGYVIRSQVGGGNGRTKAGEPLRLPQIKVGPGNGVGVVNHLAGGGDGFVLFIHPGLARPRTPDANPIVNGH